MEPRRAKRKLTVKPRRVKYNKKKKHVEKYPSPLSTKRSIEYDYSEASLIGRCDKEKSPWFEFEEEVSDEFIKRGLSASVTKSSGDYGADVIAKYRGIKIAVQVKKWKAKVSPKAVGEVLMGMGVYGCHFGCVISESGYSENCMKAASKNNIILMSIDDISDYSWLMNDRFNATQFKGVMKAQHKRVFYEAFQHIRD